MLCVCVGDVMDVVFSVCIVRRGAVCARVWGVCVFRHADVVCLCLVCILWQFCMTCSLLMLVEDAIGDQTEEAVSAFMICRGCVLVLRCCGCVCCM